MLWTDKANRYLLKYWNISKLKDKQIEVINELLSHNDVIGLLPTGYGKSMCYLIPPLVTKKVMFIISPLISLMDEQKNKLLEIGISCSALHCNNTNRGNEISDILAGHIKIVYMSPEYLITNGIELASKLIENNKLGFLAIDESHCISSWGSDFRPEYIQIKLFRIKFPDIPIIAVTATATKTVCKDIVSLLNLNNPVIIQASFDRPNLYLNVIELPTKDIIVKKKIKQINIDKDVIILDYINKYPNNKIIIYINSREETEDVAQNLNLLKPNICSAYHAGFSKEKRNEIQTNFSNGTTKIIISTIAFGMGIDQIVKCVIIFGCPSSIEEYYQQIGRGGRDGLECETILYFDKCKYNKIFHSIKNDKTKIRNLKNLKKVYDYFLLNTCKRKYVLEYFGEECNFNSCGNCNNCKKN